MRSRLRLLLELIFFTDSMSASFQITTTHWFVSVAMKKVLGQNTDDRELEKIFMKVDTNCDGTVDWDEFLSYLLLEYLEKDMIKVGNLTILPSFLYEIEIF